MGKETAIGQLVQRGESLARRIDIADQTIFKYNRCSRKGL
jgi:hypothetical protein